MPEVSDYAPGMPTWAELSTPDLEVSRRFYSGLFGWYSYTLTLPDLGDYEMFTLGGPQSPEVAGMQALADDSLPPSWTCYFKTNDVAASGRAVLAAGGQELAEPLRVAHLGRLGMYADTQGADFAVWEPYEHHRSAARDEPGTMVWVELACRDIHEARRFYSAVFDWKPVDRDYYSSTYTNWKIGDWSVAGMVHMDELWPPHYPPHWVPYFRVDDCDASAALATDLGARIRVPPSDIPPGRFSVMTDPTGARVAMVQPRRRRS